MAVHALALAEEETQTWLATCLGNKASLQAAPVSEIQRMLDYEPKYRLLFVQMDVADADSRRELISKLADRHNNLTIVAVANQTDSGDVLTAIRAGAADFLIKGQDDERIGELLSVVTKRGTNHGQQQNSHLVSILAGHADYGTALLGQHLSLVMAEMQGPSESLLFLDLARPAGAGAIFMNIQNEYSALDAVADAYRCDETLVDTAFAQHSRGPHILSLPETLVGMAEVDGDELGRFLDVVTSLFSKVVVSADRWLGEAAVHGIAERSNHTLIVSDQSILFSRHNQQMLRGMRSAGVNVDRTGLVVDRYQRRVGLEPEKLAELLQLPLYAILGGDPVNRLKAMNAGESLFESAASDEYPRGVRRLAQQLLGHSQIQPEKRGLLDKILS